MPTFVGGPLLSLRVDVLANGDYGLSVVAWTSFEDALAETADVRRHLLIGNGFSISGYGEFRYKSLIAKAREVDVALEPLLRELAASDFETGMRRATAERDRVRLRDGLIRTIAAIHPQRREIPWTARRACARFLSSFLRKSDDPLRGIIFTTNYDLLLYWVLVEFSGALDCWDGFDSDYVWASSARIPSSHVLYLHGGMHIFTRPLGIMSRTVKIESDKVRGGRRLMDVIRDHLSAGELPLFISEGTHLEKRQRINDNDYLKAAFKKFSKTCRDDHAVIFAVGHGLSEVDQHLTDQIGHGRMARAFVGVFGPDDVERVNSLAGEWNRQRRDLDAPLIDVKLFKTAECGVWNSENGIAELEPARKRRAS